MKKFILLFVMFSTMVSMTLAQKLIPVNNEAFRPGEKLKFRIHFGFIDAGEASLEISETYEKIGGRNCMHIVGIGQTKGAFDWFFKVRDRYETYLDQEAIVPWMFVRKIKEGGYSFNENVSFNHYKKTATSNKGTYPVPAQVQDLVSAYYFSRTYNTTNIKEGDIIPINTFLDDKIFPMNIKFVGRETIKTALGTFNCLKFNPMLQEGRVFKANEKMTLWISDDKNHIPIRLEAQIVVGSIKMDLSDYSGLASPVLSSK